MATESWDDVYHFASRCLIGLFDAVARGLADWQSSVQRPSVGASRSVGSPAKT